MEKERERGTMKLKNMESVEHSQHEAAGTKYQQGSRRRRRGAASYRREHMYISRSRSRKSRRKVSMIIS